MRLARFRKLISSSGEGSLTICSYYANFKSLSLSISLEIHYFFLPLPEHENISIA